MEVKDIRREITSSVDHAVGWLKELKESGNDVVDISTMIQVIEENFGTINSKTVKKVEKGTAPISKLESEDRGLIYENLQNVAEMLTEILDAIGPEYLQGLTVEPEIIIKKDFENLRDVLEFTDTYIDDIFIIYDDEFEFE